MVCSITLGPAKQISDFGSAMVISPSEAKLALTPPVVGLVSTEINSPPLFLNFSITAAVFAICIRENIPSCILAPPLALKITRGIFFLSAYSASLATSSPTTVPMLPSRNLPSSTPTAAVTPPILIISVTIASFCLVFSLFSFSFSS